MKEQITEFLLNNCSLLKEQVEWEWAKHRKRIKLIRIKRQTNTRIYGDYKNLILLSYIQKRISSELSIHLGVVEELVDITFLKEYKIL